MKWRHLSRCVLPLVLMLSWFSLVASAELVIPPTPKIYFNDFAGVVNPGVARRLNARLESFERESSNQFLVAIFKKLPEETWLEDFTEKTFKAWKPGGAKDNGVILFVFVEDRKLRFEVGYGLEGALPDSLCGMIISREIQPALKDGHFDLAMEQGIEAVIHATKGEYQGTGRTLMDAIGSRQSMVMGVLLVIFLIWLHLGDTVFQRAGRLVLWNSVDVLRFILIAVAGGRADSGGFRGGGGRSGGGGASGSW